MAMYGANPEQLNQLGTTLRRQVEPISQVESTVASMLNGTTWVGPARDRFESDWNTTFRGALERLKTALDAAGTDCVMRSQDLERVMGASH